MIGLLRVTGIVAAVSSVWIVAASQVPTPHKLALGSIVPDAVITQPFGCSALVLEPFDPYCPSHHIHTGVDLAAPQGTPVLAAAAGGVAGVAFDPGGAGLYVVVAVGGRTRVLYCHLSEASVKEGEWVATGEVIGEVGATGLATGPHLHFEVQVEGRAVDAALWLAS